MNKMIQVFVGIDHKEHMINIGLYLDNSVSLMMGYQGVWFDVHKYIYIYIHNIYSVTRINGSISWDIVGWILRVPNFEANP